MGKKTISLVGKIVPKSTISNHINKVRVKMVALSCFEFVMVWASSPFICFTVGIYNTALQTIASGPPALNSVAVLVSVISI